jgi:hypothetical protein
MNYPVYIPEEKNGECAAFFRFMVLCISNDNIE